MHITCTHPSIHTHSPTARAHPTLSSTSTPRLPTRAEEPQGVVRGRLELRAPGRGGGGVGAAGALHQGGLIQTFDSICGCMCAYVYTFYWCLCGYAYIYTSHPYPNKLTTTHTQPHHQNRRWSSRPGRRPSTTTSPPASATPPRRYSRPSATSRRCSRGMTRRFSPG